MSTPFDEESFDFLKQEKVKKIKIASFDTVNKKFLKYISKKKSHFIMSVGMSNLKEIKNAVKSLNENKNKISLLHCVSSYPTLEKDTNLSCINHLKSNFPKLEIGYSDHTNDILSSFSARVLGATIIEKHYRINNQMKCVDAPVSINQLQMTNLIKI